MSLSPDANRTARPAIPPRAHAATPARAPSAQARQRRMSKAEALDLTDQMKQVIVIGSILGFGAICALVSTRLPSELTAHAASSITTSSSSNSTTSHDQSGSSSQSPSSSSGGFFNQQGNGGYFSGSGHGGSSGGGPATSSGLS